MIINCFSHKNSFNHSSVSHHQNIIPSHVRLWSLFRDTHSQNLLKCKHSCVRVCVSGKVCAWAFNTFKWVLHGFHTSSNFTNSTSVSFSRCTKRPEIFTISPSSQTDGHMIVTFRICCPIYPYHREKTFLFDLLLSFY